MTKIKKRLPFDLDKAKAGAKIQTKSGKEVRIISFDRNNKFYPIVALVQDNPYYEDVFCYTSNGKADLERDSAYDLQIIEEVEVKPFGENDEVVEEYRLTCNGEPYSCRVNFSEISGPATAKIALRQRAESILSHKIMNDVRFGGMVTEEEMKEYNLLYCIYSKGINIGTVSNSYSILWFHTKEQASLFLKENKELINQYYMR